MAQTIDSNESSASAKSSASKTGSGKVKPSYKHIPHSQKPPHLVAKRNARERRRVQAVNQAFYKLRKCVPIENRNKRVSKVKTLQRAIDYIRKLEQTLADADDEEAAAAAGLSTATSHSLSLPAELQQQPSSRRSKKQPQVVICDQVQATSSSLDNNQQPQIMRQKRGRKPQASNQLDGLKSQSLEATLPSLGDQHCQQSGRGYTSSQAPVRGQQTSSAHLAMEAQKFPDSYFFPQHQTTCQQQQQQTPQQASEVLRESSAYNNSLNYYSHEQQQHHNQQQQHHNQHQLQQQYSSYLATATSFENNSLTSSTTQQQPYDMYTNNYSGSSAGANGSFYNQTHLANYAAYGSSGSPTNLTYLAPATPDSLNAGSWARSVTSEPICNAIVSIKAGETSSSMNDSVGSTSSSSSASSTSSSSRLLSTPLDSSTSSGPADSSTRASTSLALLQSPTTTTGSTAVASTASPGQVTSNASSASSSTSCSSTNSATAAALATSSDISSTVVGRATRAVAASSPPANRQQVNNYLAYAANRMGARAAHLSFPANTNTKTNNDNNVYRAQQQQQLDEKRSSDELRAANGCAHQVRQVRHLLNGAGLAPTTTASGTHLMMNAAALSANNLQQHDQHQQQQQQYHHYQHHHHHNHHHQQQHLHNNNHQQSSFPVDNQQPLNHLSALHSMSGISSTSSGISIGGQSPHHSNNLLGHHQPTIQEYTSLPL